MCGFVALYNLDRRPVDPVVLARATNAQKHRGPDDQGFARFSLHGDDATPEGGFGFNRLSIRDLTPTGHQPMATPDGKALMVFNGEIYNADEERPELVRRGFTFRGTSDSEVLLAMYRAYGIEETLRRVNGMFGVVIADMEAGRLVVARDHMGIKPVYLWRNGRTFAVASEVKSFLAHPDFVARLEEENLAEHLAFRACAGNRHLLKEVEQVEPGEWVAVDRSGRVERHRYFRPATQGSWRGSYRDAVDAVEAAVERSVRRQLVSDVPVGCQFSAGVDSSLVSAYANRIRAKGTYHTFSIVVRDAKFSEERWIREGERLLGVPGHRFAFGAEEFAERLERATWHLDEPLDHMKSLGIMQLAERSRPFVTVLLSGEGADEAFCGYARFHRMLMRPALRHLAPVLSRIPRLGQKVATFDASRGADDRDWFIRSSSPLLPAHLAALTGKDLHEEAMATRRAMFPSSGDFLARCRAYELETFLVGLLKRQDKMTMAHSLENRVPLIDRELVELVTSMPSSYCVDLRPRGGRDRNTKRVLKSVAEQHFPRDYVYRPKEGFGLPIADYFRSSAMEPILEDTIRSASQRGLIDARTMRRWWREELHQPFVAEALWIAMTFELWAKQVFDGGASRYLAAA